MESLQLVVCLTICLGLCGQSESKRILLVPSQVTSHMLELNSIVSDMIAKGHEVYMTIGSAFPKKDKVKKTGVKQLIFQSKTDFSIDKMAKLAFEEPMFTIMAKGSNQVLSDCEAIVEDQELMKTLQELNFDLAIVSGFLLGYCNFIVPKALGVPYVYQFSAAHPWNIGQPALPSFVPLSANALPVKQTSDKMSFTDRVQSFLLYIFLYTFNPAPANRDTTLLQKYAPDISSWTDLFKKSDLFIITRDHHLEWPAPTMPNVISVPGITVSPAKPLPEDLERIVQDYPKGFVLVSFGSIASSFPQEYTDKLVQAFNEIEYTVLWKFSGKSKEDVQVNKNVHLLDWMPQNDLLGHPNLKVFVTHGGNNGQHEALYHGVPMVGLPIAGDQAHNCFRMADHGFGIHIPGGVKDFSAQELVIAINEVASNASYKENIMKRSRILKSSPMTPTQTVTYWLEHIMEFGSDHLRGQNLDMPLYQIFMLDVIALLLLVIIVALYATKVLLTKCFKVLCSTKVKAD